ncbi:NUDIX domain-containing protein [Marinomonas sp. M1K-6]|uniref:NUDIX domain-containing protein n=1 Tax=Marinomonas profundi TaxID=2726122 RepID=A0A847R6W8_9GAMM|nr:NUDIX domain-containing protein [Marinomonas profundi]NLQ16684.1 NUDIX domain-containing protein [Marinomonas profundi]UDV03739.1 NUDIX domain-containing protein [Marinomonas profundi]
MIKEWQDGILVLNQPAGHVENNESVIDAVIRETKEEAGWIVNPIGVLGLYAFTPFDGADTYHRLCFLCEAVSETQEPLDTDIVSRHWLSYEEIMALPHRSPLIKTCIEDSFNNPIMPLSFLSDQFLRPTPTPRK